MKKCPVCQTRITNIDQQCPNCGAKINEIPQQRPSFKMRLKNGLRLFLGLLFILLSFFGLGIRIIRLIPGDFPLKEMFKKHESITSVHVSELVEKFPEYEREITELEQWTQDTVELIKKYDYSVYKPSYSVSNLPSYEVRINIYTKESQNFHLDYNLDGSYWFSFELDSRGKPIEDVTINLDEHPLVDQMSTLLGFDMKLYDQLVHTYQEDYLKSDNMEIEIKRDDGSRDECRIGVYESYPDSNKYVMSIHWLHEEK